MGFATVHAKNEFARLGCIHWAYYSAFNFLVFNVKGGFKIFMKIHWAWLLLIVVAYWLGAKYPTLATTYLKA